jgi:hypothetical protein
VFLEVTRVLALQPDKETEENLRRAIALRLEENSDPMLAAQHVVAAYLDNMVSDERNTSEPSADPLPNFDLLDDVDEVPHHPLPRAAEPETAIAKCRPVIIDLDDSMDDDAGEDPAPHADPRRSTNAPSRLSVDRPAGDDDDDNNDDDEVSLLKPSLTLSVAPSSRKYTMSALYSDAEEDDVIDLGSLRTFSLDFSTSHESKTYSTCHSLTSLAEAAIAHCHSTS